MIAEACDLIRKRFVVSIACFLLPAGLLSAHHGVAAYDYKTTIVTKATVAHFDWTNPHCKIFFDNIDDKHNVEHWVVEMHPPSNMIEHGWTRQTLSAGDVITLSFRPAKDGANSGLLIRVVLRNGLVRHP